MQIDSNKVDEHYEALVSTQTKIDKNNDTFRNYASFLIGSTVAVQHEDGGMWTHGTVLEREDHNYNKKHIWYESQRQVKWLQETAHT